MELEQPGEEKKKRWEATAAEKSGTASESEVESSEKNPSSAAVEVEELSEFSRWVMERGFLLGMCGVDEGFTAAGKQRSFENQRWKLFFLRVDMFLERGKWEMGEKIVGERERGKGGLYDGKTKSGAQNKVSQSKLNYKNYVFFYQSFVRQKACKNRNKCCHM